MNSTNRFGARIHAVPAIALVTSVVAGAIGVPGSPLAMASPAATPPVPHYDGTGVGNGGAGAYAAHQARLRKEMGLDRCRNDRCDDEEWINWCRRVSRVLGRELRRADVQIQFNRLALAKQILEGALIAASNSLGTDSLAGETDSPLTRSLIDRGVVLIEALDEALPSTSRGILLTKVKFLGDYIRMVLQIERELDQPYYVPYVHRYGRCDSHHCPPGFSYQEFEKRFIRQANRQLSFVTEQFTQRVRRDGTADWLPVGEPRAFLTVAELMTTFVAFDLKNTLYRYVHACAVQDLESLSATLRDYNWMNDRTVLPNDRWAVSETAAELERLNQELSGCSAKRR